MRNPTHGGLDDVSERSLHSSKPVRAHQLVQCESKIGTVDSVLDV